ncbi:PREDICTED: aspartyl protease AED3 [Tarenaya hassleriana]|uniref:aspartyl protease AED3 n=1 Tax=Tarenaya hassleriana TaxID=28532 RepID=UPI00053C33B5|nr:PREDICTED: aspartyl protease AED3 [Tarenaya hassleriana]
MAFSTVHFLCFFLLFLGLPAARVTNASVDPCNAFSDGSGDLSVIPIYAKCSPFAADHGGSLLDTVVKMSSNDPHRLNYLTSLVAGKPNPNSVPIGSGNQLLHTGNYVVRAKLGTPPQLMFMVLDTSSDAAWAPCTGCSGCPSAATAEVNPNSSSTFSSLSCSTAQCAQARGLTCPSSTTASPSPAACSFNHTYGGGSAFSAALVEDTLALSSDEIPGFAFGCITAVTSGGASIPPQGLLGLGRGPMSLMTQTTSLYSGVFSYCLPSFRSFYFSGSLKLGRAGQPGSIKTTPLLKNPHRPSLYYVNLTGVSVGRTRVPVDPKYLGFDPNTGAGTIVDSGTVITRFVQPVYEAIRDEFRKQVKGPFSTLGAFDTCFTADNADNAAPKITLHMTGLDLTLPMENSLIHSSAGSLSCLSMASAPNNVDSVLNVIANLQQQNLRILFDVPNSRIGIAYENCN